MIYPRSAIKNWTGLYPRYPAPPPPPPIAWSSNNSPGNGIRSRSNLCADRPCILLTYRRAGGHPGDGGDSGAGPVHTTRAVPGTTIKRRGTALIRWWFDCTIDAVAVTSLGTAQTWKSFVVTQATVADKASSRGHPVNSHAGKSY